MYHIVFAVASNDIQDMGRSIIF